MKHRLLTLCLIAIIALATVDTFGQGKVTRPGKPSTSLSSKPKTRVRITDEFISSHSVPSNFDIALKLNNQRFFVSPKLYKSLARTSETEVEGVVVMEGNMRFILAPHDITNEFLNWNEAMERYSHLLPSKEEAELWHKYKNEINIGLKAINGKILEWGVKETLINGLYHTTDTEFYWTKTEANYQGAKVEKNAGAWFTCFDGNNSLSIGRKVNWCRNGDVEYEDKSHKCRAIYRF